MKLIGSGVELEIVPVEEPEDIEAEYKFGVSASVVNWIELSVFRDSDLNRQLLAWREAFDAERRSDGLATIYIEGLAVKLANLPPRMMSAIGNVCKWRLLAA